VDAKGSKEAGYICNLCGWPVERCEIVPVYEPGVAYYQACLDCLAKIQKRKGDAEAEKEWKEQEDE
jgi:hypothetical protein